MKLSTLWTRAAQDLSPTRRYLLGAGWVLVIGLLVTLAMRPLLSAWQDARAWRELAGQATALSPAAVFSAEQWQALAAARQVLLTRVERQHGRWQLQGELSEAQALQELLRAVQAQGGRPLQWSLEQHEQGLTFSLDVAAAVQP